MLTFRPAGFIVPLLVDWGSVGSGAGFLETRRCLLENGEIEPFRTGRFQHRFLGIQQRANSAGQIEHIALGDHERPVAVSMDEITVFDLAILIHARQH